LYYVRAVPKRLFCLTAKQAAAAIPEPLKAGVSRIVGVGVVHATLSPVKAKEDFRSFLTLVYLDREDGHMKKKKFTPPKLIVLYKGRPEEAVLFNCKTGGSSYADSLTSCQYTSWGWCGSCNNITS